MKLSVLFLVLFASFSTLCATQGYLTDEDIALFYKQGYLLKRQCLSQDEVTPLKDNISAAIERALNEIRLAPDQTLSDQEQILFVDGSRVVFKRRADQSISIARINGISGMQPVLRETVRSDKLLRTFFELLNTNEIEHIISQVHPKMPGDGIAFPKHRDIQFRKSYDPDWQDILGNGSYAICIIPIDRMTPENGGLWIDRNNYPEPQGLDEDRVWIEAEPGDLLFMHPYLFHGSGPNLSPTASRKTLLTGFCAFGANHKAYPGADVNVHISLKADGSIVTEPAPWSKDATKGDVNH